ncbi:MAG: HD-like signal output (HDOD) protein [Pseudohongiellaceae bacterium]|jgi:HD-like signal output (HDOD) protein
MSNNNKTPEAWQQALKNTELRAVSGVLRELEELINQDKTTPKQLADIILKDVMLASRVLIMANSVTHNRSQTASSEGTLTQAIVRIGFKSLRAICISVALMDSLIKKMPHRQELQLCVARSFDVVVHARNVAKKTGANEEDVFIAGLFQNLGELLFWCSDIP